MPRSVRRTVESPKGDKSVSNTPDMVMVKTEVTSSPHLLDHGYGVTPQNQVIPPATPPNPAPAVKRKLNMDSHHVVVPINRDFKPPQPKKGRRSSPLKKNTR